MLVVRFLHFLGTALWIGGALVAIMLAIKAQGESADVRTSVARMLTQVHTLVIGMGALLTVGTGVAWIMMLVQGGDSGATPTPGVWIMQAAGLMGGALVLLVAIPAAVKMGGLAVLTDDGRTLPAFDYYHRRLIRVSSVALALAAISLFTGVVL